MATKGPYPGDGAAAAGTTRSADADELIARMFDQAPEGDDRTITSTYWGGDTTTIAPSFRGPPLGLASPSPSSSRRYSKPYQTRPSASKNQTRPSNAFVTAPSASPSSSKSSPNSGSGQGRRRSDDDDDDDDDVMGQRHPHVSELEIINDEESIADDLTDPTSGLPAIGCHRYDDERRDQFPSNSNGPSRPPYSSRPTGMPAVGPKPNAQHSYIDPTETSFDESDPKHDDNASASAKGGCCSKKQRRTRKCRCCLGICFCFTILLLAGVIALVVSIRNGNVQKLADSVSSGMGIGGGNGNNGGGNSGGGTGSDGGGEDKPPKQNKNEDRRKLRIRRLA